MEPVKTDDAAIRLSEAALGDEAAYRPLPALCLAALGLGLLSPVAWTAPFLLIVPAAAAGAALIALGRIARSEGRLGGAGMARLALMLALASAASAIVRGPVRAHFAQKQIDDAVASWAASVQASKLDEAKRLMTGRAVSSFTPQSEPGGPQPTEEIIQANFLHGMEHDEAAMLLRQMDGKSRLRRQGGDAPLVDEGVVTRAVCRYFAGEPGAPLVEFHLLRSPLFESEGTPWRIDRWSAVQNVSQ